MAASEIRVLAHGPLIVSGEFELLDSEGNKYDLEGKPNAAICRCGTSANKPFCDGSHKTCNFQSEVKAG